MTVGKALLVGESFLFATEISALLRRSGFDVHAVTRNENFRRIPGIDIDILPDPHGDIVGKAVAKAAEDDHRIITVLDDETLLEIKTSDIGIDEKLRLLPITSEKHCRHLCSKIGLSLTLKEHGINTPAFAVAENERDLREQIENLGCPAIVKLDFSGGGKGTCDCDGNGDIDEIAEKIDSWPVLIQEKIKGRELDLSAFYQDGKLIHFNHAVILRREASKYSPSSLRDYTQIGALKADVFDELKNLGPAIGANGFVNITCMESDADHRRYFIEADMRPNAWLNFPKYFGDDPAVRVFEYFSGGRFLEYPYPVNPAYPDRVVLPYYSRIKFWEFAINRYGAWSYLPNLKLPVILFELLDKRIRIGAVKIVKPIVPAGLWLRLKRVYGLLTKALFD